VIVAGLTLNPEVDITGLATLALVLVTLATVVIGYRALRQTQQEIALSRREVEQAQRPVVLPRREGTSARSNVTEPVYSDGMISLPIMNVGAGPALDVFAKLYPRDDHGRELPDMPDVWYAATLVGLGVGGTGEVYVYLNIVDHLPCFKLTIDYDDVAGKRWRTTGMYLNGVAIDGASRYTRLVVGSVAELPDPGIG